jgi:hypothetical protein
MQHNELNREILKFQLGKFTGKSWQLVSALMVLGSVKSSSKKTASEASNALLTFSGT